MSVYYCADGIPAFAGVLLLHVLVWNPPPSQAWARYLTLHFWTLRLCQESPNTFANPAGCGRIKRICVLVRTIPFQSHRRFCTCICLKLCAGSLWKWMQMQEYTYIQCAFTAIHPILHTCQILKNYCICAAAASAFTSVGCLHAAWGRCKNKIFIHAVKVRVLTF